VGEAGLAHQVRDAHAFDSVAADPGSSGFHDPLVTDSFIRFRAAHVSGLLTWSREPRRLIPYASRVGLAGQVWLVMLREA
jgi:hypothetical protein